MAFRFSVGKDRNGNRIMVEQEVYDLLKFARSQRLHGKLIHVECRDGDRSVLTFKDGKKKTVQTSGVRLHNILLGEIREEPARRLEWAAKNVKFNGAQ